MSEAIIPQQLILAGARFILVGKNSKEAIETGWQEGNNYDAQSPRLLSHLKGGGNYGVLVRNGICVIDIDNPAMFKKNNPNLPKSFIVMRGGGKSGHYYFKCPDCPEDMRKKHVVTWGDIRLGGNYYMVGPGCVAPTRDDPPELLPYDVVCSDPPVEIPFKTIKAIIDANSPDGKAKAGETAWKAPYQCPDKVSKGARHTELLKLAGKLINANVPASGIKEALVALNRERFDPPFSDAELGTWIDDAYRRVAQKDALRAAKKAEKKIDASQAVTEEKEEEQNALNDKAIEILKTGDPLEFLLVGFRFNHAGHEEIARAIIYAFCAQSSATSKGIQPEVTGSKGSGKTHAIASTTYLIPPKYIWESSFSPKVLYYDPPPMGAVIFIDERLSDDLRDLVKKIMSNFQRETQHKTIIEHKPITLVIPKRIVIMGSTVNGAGDDQYNDRTVQVGILNTPTDDEKYYEFEAKRREEGRPEFQLNDHIKTCRAMLKHIRDLEFFVTTPRIQFAYLHDKRLMNILFDFVEASAILNYMQRDHYEEKGVVTVTPNEDDLKAALNFEMFRMHNADAEGRLTKAETALHQKIQGSIINNEGEFTESQIAGIYGKSQNAIRKLLYGDGGTQGVIVGGLVDKTPGWYTITPATNPDFRGQCVIRCKRVQCGLRGVYAAFAN